MIIPSAEKGRITGALRQIETVSGYKDKKAITEFTRSTNVGVISVSGELRKRSAISELDGMS